MNELQSKVDLLNDMNERIKADERMYRLVCDSSSNAFIYENLENGFARSLGNFSVFFPDTEISRISDLQKIYPFIDSNSLKKFRDLTSIQKNRENDRNIETVLLSDKRTYVECEVILVSNEEGILTDKVIRFRDVTKYRAQNEELTYMAYYDPNTGLYNRNYFVRLLSDFVRRAEEHRTVVSVMFIDLDGFHNINDGMGIVVGDEIMQIFGQHILTEYHSENVLVSHFNADVYCVAIYDPHGRETPDYIFKTLKERVKSGFRISNGDLVTLSFCMGVAEYPEAAKNTLDLINCAEIVMFKAKKKGRGQIQYFDAAILNDFLKKVDIENKLKEAIFNQNFRMSFQPQYTITDRKLRGLEALIRWKDNNGNMVPPSSFIPIAERNGAIIPIGTWVIDESIRQFAEWKKDYSTNMILSLNISAIQYRAEDFVQIILGLINKHGVDPSEIELEITESLFIEDFQDVTEKLLTLRECGLRVSLDDFGTGYSSLSYLKGLPIDTLKIDKSFVDAITTDENARVILETIIYMSKKLKLETIAEGVEDQAQFLYLNDIGCDCIQGYYMGRPMEHDGVCDLLAGLK